jgi:stalled ribosome rescue protein Dom34
MKYTGIWMDKQQAYVVEMNDGEEKLETLESGLEFFNPKGGSRSKTRWGPQQVVHDSKYTEREKHQLKRYFENLASRLRNPEAMVLFGPADTKSQFKKFLDEQKPDLALRVREVLTADSMTENQVRALIREFFNTQQ